MFTRKNLIKLSRILFSLFITCLFMTCDPGLGKAVDTQAPKVSIDYPAPKEVLKDSFTMTGVASDEVKVASCEVAFRNIKTGSVYKFPANVANDKFSVTINTPKPDGSFELPDGDYNVTVSVSDAYRNSTQDIVYTIDNTAPTVLITSPNSYSESNWPNMYKTFSIKGEVYDATNISEVIVYLVDVNGTVLKQVVAEGTNTFSARFDNPFGEEKVCFYYAVAKDAGGNVNTYCYHSSDIRKLLANASQHSETTSFPSINSIGYVDQGQEKNLTDQIDESALIKVKIDNNKAEKKADSFPGFNYFAKDTAQVQWLNISKESPAGIAIGTPVLGSIMPPTDQSALDYSSITVWIASSTDGTPENFEPYTDENMVECCKIDANEVGDKQVKLKPVGESVNFQIDSHPGNNDNWKSGYYRAKIYFKTDSDIEGSDECIFQVTSGAPKLTEGNFAENEFSSYYRGYMTGKTVLESKNYLSGKSLTSDEASPVGLAWQFVGTKIDGSTEESVLTKIPSDSEGNYSIPIKINENTHENDGEYTYTITAAPDSTLSTVISRVVVIDTTNPVIILNNLENGRILDEGTYTVKGNIDDSNGIKEVHYKLFADETQITSDGSPANDWILIEGAKSTVELKLSNLEVNKNYTLKLRATDIAGNTNGEDDYTYTFNLDNVKPEISTTVSPLIMYDNDSNSETPEEETVNGTIKVNTKVSDSNKLKAVYYTFNTSLAEDADWSTQNKFTDAELSNGKIIEVDTTKYADKLPLRIKAIDGAGNYTIRVVNPVINQESDKPIIAPSNFSELNNIEEAGMTVSGGVNVYTKTNPNMIFTVSDDDLVKGYFVKINEGNYKDTPEAEVNLSQKIMSYSVKDLDYGRHTLTFKIIDQNYKNDVETPNSFVEQKFYVAIDDGQPQLSLNNANNQFVGERFDISGKVLDENGIECIHLQAKESSGIYTSLVLGNGLNDDGTFSYEFPVPAVKESIVITAVDKIGNSSSVDFTYLVDTAKPTVQVTTKNLAVNSDSPLTRVEGYAFDSESSQSDKSGIDQVRLKVGSSITGINDEESILATGSIDNNGQLTWDATLDLSDLADGTHNIYVVAFDNAGNMSDEDIATVSIDDDVPSITHGYTIDPQDYTTGDIGVKTESFIIEGLATDSSGIKTVTAKIQGQNDNLAGGYDKDTGRWEFTVPTTNDGSLVIVVSAIDNCNKRSDDVNLTVKLDSKVPSVEFTNIDANGSSKQTGSAPYVTVSCSDETSGVKNFDYKFYYKSNNADDFVEYSDDDASGTIEFEEGTNSTNIRINMASRTSANGKGPFIDQSSETDGLWKLWYSVTDNADHVAEGWSPEFIVDRHAPTPTVNNVNDLIKQGDALTVSGSVVDDFGGTIDHVTISVIHNSYNSDDLAKFKKTFTINDGLVWNPSEFVYNWTVTWDENNSPFKYPDNYEIVITAYDIAENQYEIKKAVSCDNTAPKIIFTKPYSYSVDSNGKITEGTVINSPIGNTAVNANIDKEFRMKEIYYQIGGTAEVFAEGTKGTSGYKVTGVSVINGGIQDEDEDGVDEDPIPELKGFWKKLTDANNGFTSDINTLTYFTEGKTKELLDNYDSNDKAIIQTLEIHLVAIDAAGNINYCAMPIKVDTDTDKPEVLVLSPKTVLEESKLVANVGGTTTLSGTVSDDNSVHSVWVNVELDGGNYVDGILKSRLDSDTFSVDYSNAEYGVSNPQSITVDEENKTFTLPVDDANYFKSKNKWYKVNLGENGKTTTTWNLMLNKDSEFDIAKNLQKYFATNVDLEETSLTIRVIALDEKNNDPNLSKTKLSDIKEFTLKIDSGSPSIIINNIDKIPVEGSYIGGNINYDLTFVDDGQITYWSVTAKGNKGEYEIASGSPMNNSHNETITLNTTEINDRCGNVITLKIYAEDNSKDASGQVENNKTSEETFKYTIDNSAPIASIAETIDGNPYLIATESVVGDTTGDHREIESRGNHLRIKSTTALLAGKISDEINGSGIDYVMLYFTKMENSTRYIYNAGVNEDNKTAITNKIYLKDKDGVEQQIYFPLESLKNVSRNNNCQNTTDYIIIDKAEGLLDNGSNGDRDGYDENIKANGEWMLSFDSTNLKDGVYDITYIVVDIAGNARFYTDSMFVQNHAPMINSVVLATDVNADGNCVVDELNEDGESERFDTSDEISNTGFTVRNNVLKIKVNVSGGTEPLKYFLKYRNSSNVEVTTDDTNEGYSTGIFTITDFPQDGNATYTVWVEDSVEAQLSLSSGTTEIGLTLDNQDNVKPVTQLFELNTTTEESKNSNKSRGSLYTILDSDLNEIVQGHIEPRENSTYDNTDANDPDVSGTIILRGESYDDQRISSISLNLNGNIVSIASWENNKLVGKNGATIKDELGLSGHYVEWAYPWNTNSIASQNVNVSVITQDASTNKNEEKEYESSDNIPKTVENKFSNLNWGYSKMTVDVVPYITDIKRNGGYMTKRTRSGSYPLLRGEEGNTVIGFNLTAGTIKLTIASDKNGSTTLATMERIETSGSNITFTVPKTAKDGYLHLTVNNIPSVNNTNERSLDSNLEAKDATSKFWTDDRFIRVWQDTDRFGNNQKGDTGVILAQNPAYPAMAMDDGGKLYASYTNYSMHNVYYTTIYDAEKNSGGSSTAVFNGYDSPEETTIYVTGSDSGAQVNVAYMANYQSGGSYNNWSANRADAGGLHLYDPKISSLGSEHFTDFRGYYMSRYELLYHDKQFQQFKNFRLVRKDIDMDGYIHTAYYDIDTMSIHYSNISMNMYHVGRGNFEASWVNIDGTYDEHDYAALNGTKDETKGTNIIADEAKNITLGMEYESEVFKDGLTRSSATGEYVGIDLTNDKYFPVLAYYDSVNKVVKLARANVENPKKAENNWTIQRVITDSTDSNYTTTNGNYVDMQIDSKGYVHVVFVNGRGELIYVKSTNNPNDGNSPYVFGKSVVIAENSPMNVDITVRETTPYIGYLTSLGSFDGLNTAFYDKDLDLDNDGAEEGGWETMSAPLTHAVSNNRASVEVHPNPSSASAWGESAHAYFSGGYYRAAYYIGNGNGH